MREVEEYAILAIIGLCFTDIIVVAAKRSLRIVVALYKTTYTHSSL
jgi:hypothetical protein